LAGVDARLVDVESELSVGLPTFSVIGLGGAAVQEARFRIQSSLRAAAIELPHKKITVNLAPAALRKEGAALDLPMALSLLVAIGVVAESAMAKTLAVGELSLSGALRPVRGALAIAVLARERGISQLIVPKANAGEASAVSGLRIVAATNLPELIAHLRGSAIIPAPKPIDPQPEPFTVDLHEVRGQKVARRALEIAAAGAHNLILIGSPGSGKTMLARRLPTILPPMSEAEQIEVTKTWSAAGLTIGSDGLINQRPFRAPHHTVSEGGMIGGGAPIRPGEISLAHLGVLFLDEMPELPRRVLESLRQPLEDREVVISRVRNNIRLPASFMLIGAANPCPCGWLGHPTRRCTCSAENVQRYLGRLSGPLLDRIDMIIHAPSLTAEEILGEERSEPSSAVRARVVDARALAARRAGGPNAMLSGEALRKHAHLEPTARDLLTAAIEKMDLSARSIERTLRVARTIADLNCEAEVSREAVAEALRYRHPAGLNLRAAA
jgi:magnesium chelatase family protein